MNYYDEINKLKRCIRRLNCQVGTLDEGGIIMVEDSPNQITGWWSGSQAEYDALTPVSTVIYFVTP